MPFFVPRRPKDPKASRRAGDRRPGLRWIGLCRTGLRRLGAFCGLIALVLASAAAHAQERLVFDVLRDGEKIGRHHLEFERQDAALKVSVETELSVRRVFITVFRYEHKRVERWQDGRLLSLAGMTNDDGEETELSIVLKDKEYTRTVNGQDEQMAGSVGIASLWTKDVLSGGKLLSAENEEVYRVRADLMGREMIRVGDGEVEADHYRLSGQLSRDVWYGPDGHLAQVRYEDDGYVYEFVRQE